MKSTIKRSSQAESWVDWPEHAGEWETDTWDGINLQATTLLIILWGRELLFTLLSRDFNHKPNNNLVTAMIEATGLGTASVLKDSRFLSSAESKVQQWNPGSCLPLGAGSSSLYVHRTPATSCDESMVIPALHEFWNSSAFNQILPPGGCREGEKTH